MNANSQAIIIAKQLIGIEALDTTQDALLLILGNIAEGDALRKTHNDNVLFDHYLLGRMIQVAYNTRGSENLASQSFATVSESYVVSYPETINIALRGYTKIKLL